jgi:hypothetical protein
MSRLFYSFFLGASFLLLPREISAQQRSMQNNKLIGQDAPQSQKAAIGTYQIIYKDVAHAEAVNADILYRVERARDEKEIKYLVLNEFIKIKILPKAVIQSNEYIPLKEFVIGD